MANDVKDGSFGPHPGHENESAGERRRLGGVDDVHQALICHREEDRATRAKARGRERARGQ